MAKEENIMIEMASGKIIRTVAFRMQPGEDLLLGIQKVCEEKNIKNGCILTGIGSLNGARFLIRWSFLIKKQAMATAIL